MRNLLNFILKYNYWFLFILLEIISFALLFRFNSYQGSVIFTSANGVAGKVYDTSAQVTSYFHLKEVNNQLIDRNVLLEKQLNVMRYRLMAKGDTLQPIDSLTKVLFRNFSLVKAEVINNSISHRNNYLTLNKGEADGIRPEMGVIDGRGVVGIVYLVSSHYSIVLSLLNSKSNISCKVRNRNYFGFLRWDGGDALHAWLEEIPRYARCRKGDAVVTSGYSAVFPRGIFVGIVENIYNSPDGMSYRLRVRLSTDFSKLSSVRVITNSNIDELQKLEQKVVEKNDSTR